MSSESVSSGMVQKTVEADLVSGKLVLRGAPEVLVDMACPKLDVGKLYESLFADIEAPTQISIESSSTVKGNEKAAKILDSIKRIVDEACEKINSELPVLLQSQAEKQSEEKALLQEAVS